MKWDLGKSVFFFAQLNLRVHFFFIQQSVLSCFMFSFLLLSLICELFCFARWVFFI